MPVPPGDTLNVVRARSLGRHVPRCIVPFTSCPDSTPLPVAA